jgi:hypothetical protein
MTVNFLTGNIKYLKPYFTKGLLNYLLFSMVFILITGCHKNDSQPALPEVTVSGNEVMEGDLASVKRTVDLKLSSAENVPVTVAYETEDSTAKAGIDYVAVDGGSFTFKAGETSGSIEIEIISDTIMEFTKQFILKFTGVTNASISADHFIINITDNDLIKTGEDSDGVTMPAGLTGMKLVWTDEFNGSQLNPADWNYEQGGGGWGNNELEVYTNHEDNVYTADGKLFIAALNNQGSYTSGRITTQGKQVFQYGLINIRAKLPEGQGIWPALWMLGSNISVVNWPNCGEIDIMELLGHMPGTVYGTAHWFQGSLTSKGNHFTLEGDSNFAGKYHIFSLLWEADRIVWYVDFVKYYELRKSVSDTGWPFNAPFFFIFNVAVGGNWPGPPDDTTEFPQNMNVDYIRIYEPD